MAMGQAYICLIHFYKRYKFINMDLRKCSVPLNPSLVPTDVTFVISQCGSEVKAHRWVMAMGSPVLQKQFYGGLATGTEERISVQETTKEAFVRMVDFLYGKVINWEVLTVEELFNIANMAEKYHIDALKENVKKSLQTYPLSEDNVVMCASIAREYHQFVELSQELFLHCTEFLKSVVVKAEDYEAFAAKYCDSDLGETAIKLLGMMSKVAPVPAARRSGDNMASSDPLMMYYSYKLHTLGTRVNTRQ